MMPTYPTFTLVSHVLCPYAQRAAIVLAEKGVPFERRDIDLANRPDWFKEASPLGKVPLLQVGDTTLFESAVICDYLDEALPGPLHPTDPLDKAKHRGWIEFASALLDTIAGFYAARDAATFAAKQAAIRGKIEWLERHLGPGPFFAGARFQLVDAVYGPVFRYFDAFDRIGDFGFLDGLDKLPAWRRALADRPSVRGAVIADFPARLLAFLAARGGILSSLMADQVKTASTPV